MSSSPVHVEVMEEVCWPPKSTAMRRPVISSSVRPLPFLYLDGSRGGGEEVRRGERRQRA